MHTLSAHLLDVGRSLPIHVLPGELDPSAVILPQQPLPRAMFGPVAKLPTFFTETNPTYLRVVPGDVSQPEDSEDPAYENSISESHPEALSRLRTILVNSGQPLNDLFKYLPNRSNSRLAILESTLRWRHMSPTAPDTLWCHPYLSEDPFIFYETPDLYIVGGQKRFGTKLVVDDDLHDEQKRKTRCRIVMVPHFSRTGVLVLVNMRTLDVKCLQFAFEGMRGGGDKDVSLEGACFYSLQPTTVLTTF
jgi:DNA polymerase delta subunit 2